MAKRRQWMDDLRHENVQKKRKSKINILSEEIYIEGKLVTS